MNLSSQVNLNVNKFNILTGVILIIVKPALKLDQIKEALRKQEELEPEEKKRIGEILIDMEAITSEDLELALRVQSFIKNKINLRPNIVSIDLDINYSL
ncbi:MAG: hypothetical protein V1872_08270 [bacterium]